MILDANGLSALGDGDPGLEPILPEADNLAAPTVVLGEYRYGIRQSRERLRLQHALPVVSRDRHFDAVSGVRRLDG